MGFDESGTGLAVGGDDDNGEAGCRQRCDIVSLEYS